MKKNKQSPPVNKLYLIFSETHTQGSNHSPGDGSPYSGYRDSHCNVQFESILSQMPHSSVHLEVDFSPVPGMDVYLVVPRYSTGGTFGGETGRWEVHKICLTEEAARATKQAIYKEYDVYKADKLNPSRRRKDYESRPWMGYFERLETVEIHRMKVDDNYGRIE